MCGGQIRLAGAALAFLLANLCVDSAPAGRVAAGSGEEGGGARPKLRTTGAGAFDFYRDSKEGLLRNVDRGSEEFKAYMDSLSSNAALVRDSQAMGDWGGGGDKEREVRGARAAMLRELDLGQGWDALLRFRRTGTIVPSMSTNARVKNKNRPLLLCLRFYYSQEPEFLVDPVISAGASVSNIIQEWERHLEVQQGSNCLTTGGGYAPKYSLCEGCMIQEAIGEMGGWENGREAECCSCPASCCHRCPNPQSKLQTASTTCAITDPKTSPPAATSTPS